MNEQPMLRETLSLPSLLEEILDPLLVSTKSAFSSPEQRQIDTVYLYGSGDSLNAAVCAAQAFREYAGVAAFAVPALEAARYIAPCLRRGCAARTLAIGISSSGEAQRSVEAAMAFQHAGCRTGVVTANPASSIAGYCESVWVSGLPPFSSGSRIPVPGIRSFLASVVPLFVLALRLGSQNAALDEEEADSALHELRSQGAVLRQFFEQQGAALQPFADLVGKTERLELIAPGPVRGAADFAVSKVLEAAGYGARSQDTEEFAHQTFFLLDAGSLPTVLMIPGKSRSLSRSREIRTVLRHLRRPLLILTDLQEESSGEEGESTAAFSIPISECIAPISFACAAAYLASSVPLREGDIYMHGHRGVYCEDGLPTIHGSSIEAPL